MITNSNNLDSILSTFTKTQTKLRKYLENQGFREVSLAEQAASIKEQQATVKADKARATKVLGKIDEILS